MSMLIPFTEGLVSIVDIRKDPKRFPRIATIDRQEAEGAMSNIIHMAFTYRGQPTDANNVRFIATNLLSELLEDTKYGLRYLSLEEIRRAIKKAVLNESNLFVSISSLYRVLVEYAKGEGHRAEEELRKMKSEEDTKRLKDSAPGAMIQLYTGRFLKNNTIK